MSYSEQYRAQVLALDPVAYWRFGEPDGSSGKFNEETGNLGIDGERYDIQNIGSGVTYGVPGPFGEPNAIRLDNAVCRQGGNTLDWPLESNQAIAFWARYIPGTMPAPGGYAPQLGTQPVLMSRGTSTTTTWQVYVWTPLNQITIHDGLNQVPGPVNSISEEWTHYVFLNGDELGGGQWVINGVAAPMQPALDFYPVRSAVELVLGDNDVTFGQPGRFDLADLALYNWVPPADELWTASQEDVSCNHDLGRNISAELEAEFGLPAGQYTFCWAIQPKGRAPGDRPIEGYTAHDRDVTLPYVLDRQNREMLPSLTYIAQGNVLPSEVAVNIGLSSDSMDVGHLLPTGSTTRQKLLTEYYNDAIVTVMAYKWSNAAAGVVILMGGKLGPGKIDDVSATFQLKPWSSLLQRPILRVIQPLCDCEEFAQGRCSAVAGNNDGPQIADRTATATITAVLNRAQFTVSIDAGPTTGTVADGWANFGRLYFTEENPGPNDGLPPRRVKRFTSLSGDSYEVLLNNELPFLPEAGNTVGIEEGCDHTWAACILKDNKVNFQGQPYVPGRQGVMTKYSTE
jgi:hypothetical protein